MVIRSVVAAFAVLSLSACDHGDKAAIEADQTAASTASTGPAEAVLVEVWQAANPGQTPPGIDDLSAAFDPGFAQIAKAGNDVDNAFITSTLTFIKAVQSADPRFCAEAPLARFRPETLAAVPAEALPAFRKMLTDRLAVITDGASHTAPSENLMSGSMQSLSAALGDGQALELLPQIMSGATYDAAAGCAATITAWEGFNTVTQSPQLMKALYSGEL